MVLNRDDGKDFSSPYFNELYARYQDRIISEANRCKDIECPYEIYGILCGFFMKIAGKFNRNTNMVKTGERWFGSYFWRSIKNKVADIKKTKNYGKRAPGVVCAICNSEVGQITSNHLVLAGHEEIFHQV